MKQFCFLTAIHLQAVLSTGPIFLLPSKTMVCQVAFSASVIDATELQGTFGIKLYPRDSMCYWNKIYLSSILAYYKVPAFIIVAQNNT